MKQNVSNIPNLAVPGFLTALLVVGCVSLQAQAVSEPLTTDVTMTTSSTITQDEPIVTQRNVTDGFRPVDTNTTNDQTGLFNSD